jgi:hypothetical protein
MRNYLKAIEIQINSRLKFCSFACQCQPTTTSKFRGGILHEWITNKILGGEILGVVVRFGRLKYVSYQRTLECISIGRLARFRPQIRLSFPPTSI